MRISPFFAVGQLGLVDDVYSIRHNEKMKYILETTKIFDKWIKSIKDPTTKRRILACLALAENGHFGDHKFFGDIGELRFTFGGGIRVYYTIRNQKIVFQLKGSNKSSQEQDFKTARAMLDELKD